MSVMEKVQLMCQIRTQKTNTREPLLTCRKSAKSVSKSGSFVAPRPAYRLPVYWISDTRHRDGVSWVQAFMWNCRNLSFRCQGRNSRRDPLRVRVSMRSTGAEQLVVAMQYRNGYWAKRLRYSVGIDNQPVMGGIQGVNKAI